MSEKVSLHVFIISDATGLTAESVIKAVLVQFAEIRPRLIKFSNVRSSDEILRILDQAQKARGIVIYSLVSRELSDLIRSKAEQFNLIIFDLLGPLIGKVRRLFNLIPAATPGLLEHVHEESIRLAEAIDFTLKHDDGLGMETIHEADLIILGVSRTCKTPSSIYLACNYLLKVANIPILMDQDLPKEIYSLDVSKVGFTIDPERLAAIRKSRIKHLPDYTDLRQIHREVSHGETILQRLPRVRMIDVTHLSIEEVASKIVEVTSRLT